MRKIVILFTFYLLGKMMVNLLIFFNILAAIFSFSERIAALQMNPTGLTSKQRFEKAKHFIETAAKNESSIALLPAQWMEYYEEIEGDFRTIAKENDIDICFSFSKKISNETYKVAKIVNRQGAIVLSYEKVVSPEPFQGIEFNHTTLWSKQGGSFGVGVLFKDDILYPESTRVLMLDGVELYLVLSNEKVEELYHNKLQTRVYENVNAILFANPSSSSSNADIGSFGKSYYSSYQLKPQSLDERTEGILYADVDFQDMRNFRNKMEPLSENIELGDSFRRPYCYRSLCWDAYEPKNVPVVTEEASTADVVVKIGLLQMNPGKDLKENIEIAEKHVRMAAEQDCDIVIMPEMWNIGYFTLIPDNPTDLQRYQWLGLAVSSTSSYVEHFRKLAVELEMAIGVTYMEYVADDHPPRNSISIIDRHGNTVYTYSKIHTCVFTEEINLSPGRKMFTGILDTKRGDVVIGSLICYDRASTEPARLLMQAGTELLIAANACVFTEMMIMQLGVRAAENAFPIALCNYADGQKTMYNGNSVIYNHEGEFITHASSGEGVFVGEVNISKVREFRKTQLGKSLTTIVKHPEQCRLKRNPLFHKDNRFHRAAGSVT